jgi:hypothetical protein
MRKVMTDVNLDEGEYLTDQMMDVLRWADRALELYLAKAPGYGETADNLGARGQFAEIWRKTGKLKHLLWDGAPVPPGAGSESVEEVLYDMVGHALLCVDYIHRMDNRPPGWLMESSLGGDPINTMSMPELDPMLLPDGNVRLPNGRIMTWNNKMFGWVDALAPDWVLP